MFTMEAGIGPENPIPVRSLQRMPVLVDACAMYLSEEQAKPDNMEQHQARHVCCKLNGTINIPKCK
jgi:hypothetical protein